VENLNNQIGEEKVKEITQVELLAISVRMLNLLQKQMYQISHQKNLQEKKYESIKFGVLQIRQSSAVVTFEYRSTNQLNLAHTTIALYVSAG
jgi:hypothetical protein